MNILFVCTGNTCRSPMCEGFFRKLIQDAHAGGIRCKSAGTCTCDGLPVSRNALTVMKSAGIDLANHRSSQISEQLIAEADLIVVMTASHRAAVLAQYPEVRSKTVLLSDFRSGTGGHADIADPYGGSETVYRNCFEEMKEPLQNLLLDTLKQQKST